MKFDFKDSIKVSTSKAINSINRYYNVSINNLKENKENIFKTAEIIRRIITTLTLASLIFSIWSTDEKNIITPLSFILFKNVQIIITIIFVVWIINIWSKKDELSKLYKNIILNIIITISLSVPLVLLILHIGRLFGINSEIKIGTADGWLAFFGSIIGGLITMFSLFYSIRHMNYQNREAFNQKIMPILVCENDNSDSYDDLIKLLNIKLTNTSENTLLNLQLKSIMLLGYQNLEDKKSQKYKFSSHTDNSNFTLKSNSIKPNCTFVLGRIGIVQPNTYIRDKYINFLDIFYTFGYTDVYSKKEYIVKLKVETITQISKNRIQYTYENETLYMKEYIMTSQKVELLTK